MYEKEKKNNYFIKGILYFFKNKNTHSFFY